MGVARAACRRIVPASEIDYAWRRVSDAAGRIGGQYVPARFWPWVLGAGYEQSFRPLGVIVPEGVTAEALVLEWQVAEGHR